MVTWLQVSMRATGKILQYLPERHRILQKMLYCYNSAEFSKCCQFMCSLEDRKYFQSCCKCMPQNPHIALLPFNYTKGNIEKSAPSQISYIKSIFNQPPLRPPFTLKQGVVNLQLDLENSQSWFCKLVDKFAWFAIFCFFYMTRAAEWRSGSVLGP